MILNCHAGNLKYEVMLQTQALSQETSKDL